MRKKWEDTQIQIDYSAISGDEYNQLLDEWANTVYSYFCQHRNDQIKAPVTFNKKAGA
jgi:hypothetical protein